MTTKLLNISTADLKKSNPLLKTHDFSIQIDNLYLEPKYDWEIALYNFSMYYTWFNITNLNNQFRYWNGSVFKTLSIASGNYGVSDLNSAIKTGVNALGDTGDNIEFTSNFSTLKVDLILLNSYQVDFRDVNSNNFRTLFGFSSNLFTSSQAGDLSPDITNGIDSVAIACSLVSSNDNYINNKSNNFIYSFVPNTGVGSNLNAGAGVANPLYLPISVKGSVGSFDISVRATDGSLLDLNGENTSYTLVIRPKKND